MREGRRKGEREWGRTREGKEEEQYKEERKG